MPKRIGRWLKRLWLPIAIAAVLAGHWLLPISGRVIFTADDLLDGKVWPQMTIAPSAPQPGEAISISVADHVPWGNVHLTVDGQVATLNGWQEQPLLNTWVWLWTIPMPATDQPDIVFYVECHTGCKERGRLYLPMGDDGSIRSIQEASLGQATKLCTVLPDPNRNWHGRSGFVVDMTYMKLADDAIDPYWSVDALASRVHVAAEDGVRVLIRVEFDRGQTLPPANDHIALSEYLAFVKRLANDDRLRDAEAFVIGTGPNSPGSNMLAPDRQITPEWFARVLNGYGEPIDHANNVIQTIHRIRPAAKVIVGSVQPWIEDQDGSDKFLMDVPWLNYMNTLTYALDQTASEKNAAGIIDAAPDGFALQSPGRPDDAEIDRDRRGEEPQTDLKRTEWGNAQAGFRVYQDWLVIINDYATTRGLPAYITATNTYAGADSASPAQNYPSGWLTNALSVVNQEPQIRSLCWFMDDVPNDDQWNGFSLTRHTGQLIYAAEEFDALLQQE